MMLYQTHVFSWYQTSQLRVCNISAHTFAFRREGSSRLDRGDDLREHMLVRSCCEPWALEGTRRNCEAPATSSVAIVLL
jgi:hypothetical protein